MTFDQAIFRYLNDPQECWRNDEPADCVVCGLLRPGYGFLQECEVGYDELHVCEPCLIGGRLEEVDLCINAADMPRVEREAIINERTAEIEQRTPQPNVLNLFTWPAHCGDYCVYHRQVDADDLNRLAADHDGKTFLIAHLHGDDADVDEEFINSVWDDDLKGFIRFYLWRCTRCLAYRITWDSD